MKEIRTLRELVFQQGKKDIYRRILRMALWGSCVTFVVMGGIFLASIFILQNELQQQSKDFSQGIGNYVEEAVQQEVEDCLTEKTILRARLVRRMLDNCSLNVEILAGEMGDILQHNLADSFNHMTEELAAYMEKLAKTTAQKERIDTELAVATRIQTGLPGTPERLGEVFV